MNRRESGARNLPALAVGLVVLFAGASAGIAGGEVVTLKGEIEVAELEKGQPTAASIYDEGWGWVLISNEGKGKELLGHIGAIAEVTGEIVEIDDDVAGEFSHEIAVTRYTITVPAELEPTEDWDYDEQE